MNPVFNNSASDINNAKFSEYFWYWLGGGVVLIIQVVDCGEYVRKCLISYMHKKIGIYERDLTLDVYDTEEELDPVNSNLDVNEDDR